MSRVETALAELGFQVPEAPKPVASYVAAVQTGNLVYTAGQLPLRDGQLTVKGIVGRDVEQAEAAEAARLCTVNALAAVKSVIGDLDLVTRVVKVVVFVASDPGFTNQPEVANGASELLLQAFGEAGKHARSAVGAPSLPRNTPVEVELIVEVG